MIYQILEENLYSLTAQVEKINKRLEKLGLKTAVFNVLNKETVVKDVYDDVQGKTITIPKVVVNVEVVAPEELKANGWVFVATVINTDNGNVFKTLSNTYKIPETYRNIGPICEHCKTIRNRKDTYLVHNTETGDFKMVGKSCLKDFTGHKNPEMIAAAAEYLSVLNNLFEEELGSAGVCKAEISYNLKEVMNISSQIIEKEGFISRAKAEDMGCSSTAEMVKNVLFGNAKEAPESEAAQKAIEWAQNIDTTDNDYLWNLHIVAVSERIPARFIGIAVSMIPAYDRAMAVKREAEMKNDLINEHFGTVKEKIEVEGVLLKRFSFETAYGVSHIHTFIINGKNACWMTSKSVGDAGKRYKIKATIKGHTEYKGTKQTNLIRCNLTEI